MKIILLLLKKKLFKINCEIMEYVSEMYFFLFKNTIDYFLNK